MRSCAHAQSLRNPFHGHRGFGAETPGDVDFGAIAFPQTSQRFLGPTQTLELLGHNMARLNRARLMDLITVMPGTGEIAYLGQQIGLELFIAEAPIAGKRERVIQVFPCPASFEPAFELRSPGRGVFLNAALAEHSVEAQPARAFGGE